MSTDDDELDWIEETGDVLALAALHLGRVLGNATETERDEALAEYRKFMRELA